jgi:adenylate cyclase class IV
MRAILLRAGFRETFRYEKRREIWRLGRATVCLDATPLGAFVEIEGSPREIDRRARALGLKPASGGTPSITASYPALWRAAGNRGDMLLSQSVRTRR